MVFCQRNQSNGSGQKACDFEKRFNLELSDRVVGKKKLFKQLKIKMMNKVNLTIVATINPDGKEELSQYVEKVGELYSKVNAKPVNKFKITKPLIGDYHPSLVSIMEFPDITSLNEVFESD